MNLLRRGRPGAFESQPCWWLGIRRCPRKKKKPTVISPSPGSCLRSGVVVSWCWCWCCNFCCCGVNVVVVNLLFWCWDCCCGVVFLLGFILVFIFSLVGCWCCGALLCCCDCCCYVFFGLMLFTCLMCCCFKGSCVVVLKVAVLLFQK